jgi:hypothetical protein
MDDEWKSKGIQKLVDKGILVEDPDGLLWMSDRMKQIIEDFNKDEKIKELITKRAKDEDDFERGCWSYIYMMYVEDAASDELNEAVAVLKGWNKGARENQLDEWSMGLRFR